MNLKQKLILSFCCFILLPLALSSLLVVGIYLNQREAFRIRYGVTLEFSDLIAGDSGVSDRLALSVHDTLQEQVASDPVFLSDEEKLKDLAEEKSFASFAVTVWRGETLLSDPGDLSEEALRQAKASISSLQGDCTTVHHAGSRWLVYDIFTQDTDSGRIAVIGLRDSARRFPLERNIMRQFGVSIVFILILTAGVCTIWIYRPTMLEVGVLEDAAERIREGDLDFHIRSGGKDELGQLCRTFEETRQRLKDAQEEKLQTDAANRELIRNISHDLKTPITAIRGYVEGIRDGVASTPEKRNQYLNVIIRRTEEMTQLIDELSFYTRMDSEGIPYNFRVMRAADFIGDCGDAFDSQLTADGADFSFCCELSPETEIAVDPEQMHRVFSNIIGNSLKYADKKPCRITMEATETKGGIRLEIADNGKGIAAKDLPHIFERFYRADAARTATGGSGIGLSIVKKIVEDHGGAVEAESTPGRGTAMIITLPRYRKSPAAERSRDGENTDC